MTVIFGVIFIAAGAAIAAFAVYNRFFRSFRPDQKRWIRVRVKNGEPNSYSERTVSKYGSGMKYGTEYPITYEVNGKKYSAYTEEKCTHVFCRRSNPSYFKEQAYFRGLKWAMHNNFLLIFSLIAGFAFVVIGIAILQ